MKRFTYTALVRQEAKNLKKFATKEELQRLSEFKFNPKLPTQCVYGLMTGSCYNDRSVELIEKSCPRVYKNQPNTWHEDRLSNKLNGSPLKSNRANYWSAIEVFIYPYERKEAAIRLLKYLKGEIKTL